MIPSTKQTTNGGEPMCKRSDAEHGEHEVARLAQLVVHVGAVHRHRAFREVDHPSALPVTTRPIASEA